MRKELMNYMLETLEIAGEDAEELLELFRETFDEHRQLMRQAAERRDFLELRKYTHAMTGCAGNVGAERIVDVVQQVNAAAKDGDADACLSGINLLDQLYDDLTAD